MPAIAPIEEEAGRVRRRKRDKPTEDKATTAQGDLEVASSTCKKLTVLLFMFQTAILLLLVAYVVVSLTKLSAIKEQLTQLQISSKSGICQSPNARVKFKFKNLKIAS